MTITYKFIFLYAMAKKHTINTFALYERPNLLTININNWIEGILGIGER